MPTKRSNIFTVDLTGLDLDDKQHAAIQQAVSNAALAEIAKTRPGGFASGTRLPKFPIWNGIWIRPIDLKNVSDLTKDINVG